MSGSKIITRFGIMLVTGIIFLCLVPSIHIGYLQSDETPNVLLSGEWTDPDPLSNIPASQFCPASWAPLVAPATDPLTPVCPTGYTEVTSIDGTQHCKGPDGYIYEMTPPGQVPERSADKYQWLGDHPPTATGTMSHSYTTTPVGDYETVEPSASNIIPASILSKMRKPHLDWTPPAYTTTALPKASIIIGPDDSLSRVNEASPGQLVVVRGDHSSEIMVLTRSIFVKGENGAIVKGIDIKAPCVITGFSVTGRQVGIFANGVSGSDKYPFVIEGNHMYLNGYGLRLYYCNNVIIKNNLLESNSEIELHIEHMDNGKIVGNNLGEATYQPGGGSVDVDGAALRYLTNCVFEDNYIGEHYYGTRWYSSSHCTIKGNTYRNSGTNLRLGKTYGGGDYGQCEDMKVTGNDIRGGTDAIWAQACVNCVFNNNVLKSKYGFKYGSLGQNGSGSGNQIESVVPAYG
jgi:parallel beta-helix repeat protein